MLACQCTYYGEAPYLRTTWHAVAWPPGRLATVYLRVAGTATRIGTHQSRLWEQEQCCPRLCPMLDTQCSLPRASELIWLCVSPLGNSAKPKQGHHHHQHQVCVMDDTRWGSLVCHGRRPGCCLEGRRVEGRAAESASSTSRQRPRALPRPWLADKDVILSFIPFVQPRNVERSIYRQRWGDPYDLRDGRWMKLWRSPKDWPVLTASRSQTHLGGLVSM